MEDQIVIEKAARSAPENAEKENQCPDTDSLLITTMTGDFSLQDKFKEFKKQRKEKFKNKQYLRTKKMNDRGTKEFQDLLRNKFVETAKKYLGVPYAKRYFKPEDQHYNSPLFLDCCALVRQVVHDLREDFGFTLGRWNQAYQYDTLPIDVNFEDMRPGDLVFYSGTYYDSKKKKQRHDMVHVEIFLGGPTGEQTIGARWNNGVVSIFDSYKFVSKGYYDIKFYYKSIDTWLQGTLKNYCDKHIWDIDRSALISDKFSVFTEADEDDGEEADGNGPEDSGNGLADEEAKAGEDGERKVKDKAKSAPKKVFIGKGNNERLIRNYFNDEKYVVLDQKMAFTNKYDIRWVQLLNEVDFLSFKEGTQLVNHVSNINIIAAKNGLIQTMRDFEANNPDFDGIKMAEFMPPTFRLDILSDEFLFMNSPSEGIWITKPYNANKGINLKIVKDITKFKDDFLNTKRFNLGKYIPNEAFRDKMINETLKNTENTEADDNEEPSSKKNKYRVIIQKYIDKPLLLENKKFDIRCYMLIATTKPLFVLFHHGYCRLCISDYTLEVNEKDELDKFAHITNNAIQKKHPDYANQKEGSIWTMGAFETYLKERLGVSQERIQEVYHKIKKMLAHTIRCAEFKMDKKIGYFELLGCDILLDENLNPYLLEVNSNPAISTNIEAHRETIPKVVNTTLDLVLQLDEQKDRLPEVIREADKLDLGEFEVLFNKETGYIYS